MSNLSFAPGETNVHSEKFSPSVIMFWLKTEIASTNMRIVSKSPNTLLGLIPLGYRDAAFPLSNVSSVGVEVKFSMKRAIFGLILLFISFALLDNFFGWVLLLISVSMLLNSISASLKIQNNGGAVTELRVSILEKSKLEQLRDDINSRLFADHAGIRHQETMDVGRASLLNQQAQIDLQQRNGGSSQGNYPTQPPQAPTR
ncbi:hypothetical protein [Arthrobacter flavus]|uniref:Uncharacterized protein n=1 Tax=Arthrobacter flavus TaxID=95172 RepID=A0ABW4Q3A2_9MICC